MTTVSIGDLAAVSAGGAAPQDPNDFSRDGYPFVRAGSLVKLKTGMPEGALERILPEVAVRHGLRLYPPGTIVFAKSGMSATKGLIYRLVTECYVVSHLAALVPKLPTDGPFLAHLLEWASPSRLIRDEAYPSIRLADIERMQAEVPANAVERAELAAILDRGAELRSKRRVAYGLLDTLAESVFFEMFGDPSTNPYGFPVRRLPEFYVSKAEGTRCGPFGSTLKKSEMATSGVPVWSMDNIGPLGRMNLPFRAWVSYEKFRQLEAFAVKDGDVLISRAGTVGKMCVASSGEARSIISTNLIRLRFGPELLPVFFVGLMTYAKGRVARLRIGPDGSFTHMSTGILDTLKFPYPPLELQARFASIVDEINAQIGMNQQVLNHLDALVRSLRGRAFGEVMTNGRTAG